MDKVSESSSIVGKIWIEICLISARGLPRSSLLKYQWYAVGWIDPKDKYCTKIDASGNANPEWKTKFTTVIDASVSDVSDLALNVEVYSSEPLFLREKLQGTATILLREFLGKYRKNTQEGKMGVGDLGSFQLRKRNSNKPHGFIDISVKISDEKAGTSSCSFLGKEEGFNLHDSSAGITLTTGEGPMQPYPGRQAEPPFNTPGNPRPPAANPYTHPIPYPRNYSHPNIGMPSYPQASGPSYPAQHMPQPPTPPSNAGYMPAFLPDYSQSTFMNMPPSGGAGRGAGRGAGLGPAFGVGLGAGALAAGAMLYGDDIMSNFELPRGLRDPSLILSYDSPF